MRNKLSGDIEEHDLPAKPSPAAGIITTNRSSLNTDCGALPNAATNHNPAQSNIHITKHEQIKTKTQTLPILSILNILKGNFHLWLHNCPARWRLQHSRAASLRCEK